MGVTVDSIPVREYKVVKSSSTNGYQPYVWEGDSFFGLAGIQMFGDNKDKPCLVVGGWPNSGLRTSIVQEVKTNEDGSYEVHTLNSVYTLVPKPEVLSES